MKGVNISFQSRTNKYINSLDCIMLPKIKILSAGYFIAEILSDVGI